MVVLLLLEDDDGHVAAAQEEFLWASLGQSAHFDSTELSFVATAILLVDARDLSLLQ